MCMVKRGHFFTPHSALHIPHSSSGYALYFVVIILTLIGIFTSVMISTAGHASVMAARQLKLVQARELAYSGLSRAAFFLNGGENRGMDWTTDSLAEPVAGFGTIDLSCRTFGVFSLINSRGTRIDVSKEMTVLAGRNMPDSLNPVITLTGSVAGLLIDDRTSIQGAVVFTNGYLGRGTRKRRIPGSDKWTYLRLSPRLPFDPAPVDTVLAQLPKLLAESLSDSSAVKGDLDLSQCPDSVRSRNRIVVLGNCRVPGAKLNNQAVYCAGTLVLADGARCEATSFVAESISVEGGATTHCLFYSVSPLRVKSGRHDSQFLCGDTISVSKDVVLGPSTACISKRTLVKDTIPHGGVFYEKSGNYSGTAICYADSAVRANNRLKGTDISIDKQTTFRGNVITDGDCVLGAKEFHGHLWARSVAGIDGEGKPSPHFLYCTKIDTSGVGILFPLVGRTPAQIVFAESWTGGPQ